MVFDTRNAFCGQWSSLVFVLGCFVLCSHLNVVGLERTVKEASLGSQKKTNLNKKINFTTKQKYFHLPCSALLTITFLSKYLMSQNSSGDSEF